MPRSRSKRTSYRPPPARKPPRSPRWLPYLGLGLIAMGMVVVVLSYLVAALDGALGLLVGFTLMAGGLVALSRLR